MDMEDASTFVSLVTATVATLVSLFLLHQGQVDRRQLRREQERSQAQQVSSWGDWYSDDFMTFAQPRVPAVFVANASSAAVYDVFVDFRAPNTGAMLRKSIGPIPPGERRMAQIDFEGSLGEEWEPASLFPRVFYRDSAGQRWLRDGIGRLREDPGPGADGFFEAGGRRID